jgi:hypothetical protein
LRRQMPISVCGSCRVEPTWCELSTTSIVKTAGFEEGAMAARVATAQSVTGRAQAKTGDRRTPVASMHVLSRATNRSANRNTDRDLTAADALHPRPSTRPSLENNGDFARTPLTQSRTLSSTSTPLRAPPSLRNSPVAVHLAAPQRGAAGTADLLACVGAVRHNPASCGSRRRILHDRSRRAGGGRRFAAHHAPAVR